MKSLFFTLGAALIQPFAAQAQTYECSFPELEMNGGWIAPDIAFAVDRERDEVYVHDGIILYFVGNPVSGQISSDTGAKLTIKWSVEGKDPQNNHANMRYSLTYFKAKGEAVVSMVPGGYDNSFRAPGTCKEAKG